MIWKRPEGKGNHQVVHTWWGEGGAIELIIGAVFGSIAPLFFIQTKSVRFAQTRSLLARFADTAARWRQNRSFSL